jgi:hypothetical protein
VVWRDIRPDAIDGVLRMVTDMGIIEPKMVLNKPGYVYKGIKKCHAQFVDIWKQKSGISESNQNPQ